MLFILLIVFNLGYFAQSAKIDANIKKTDNSQFSILHQKEPGFSMKSSPAHKLIRIGKKATEKLIVALDDSSKVIMAHLILCHIWFAHVSFAGPKTVVTNNGDVFKYYLGEEKGEGLLISEIKKEDGTYIKYIEQKDLEKIKIYWNNKVTKSKSENK
ncbi:MAG: hypothetical protein ABIP51_11375 [Bacteroidia bacterium]